MSKLNSQEIQKHTVKLKNWEISQDRTKITASYKFKDFKQAWAFMNGCALKAEQMQHHPEWSNVYNKVDVELTTHDAGGLTEKDFELASFMDEFSK
ncbi:MAG: 4a-hydroxytetrahydrobiopterin dehydratase [Alphaproteobacteria bacterium]|nr:4a-hydroxytetrahydrobiopterin dehydratase [Alphaproteobacteria bacterium]|tara:strand:+ start:708 stop:995 length:288 start_codon:yes stop_codon:yes gene_type:complete